MYCVLIYRFISQLTVVVEDKAENVMSDSATVVIYVTDVNDEPAIFNEDVYM